MDVFVVGDVAGTHGTEVWGLKLTVDETASVLLEEAGKVDESEF